MNKALEKYRLMIAMVCQIPRIRNIPLRYLPVLPLCRDRQHIHLN